MVCRKAVAALGALSLLAAPIPAFAQSNDPNSATVPGQEPAPAPAPSPAPAPTQTEADEAPNPLDNEDAFTQSGLLLMLTAIVGAVLLAFLATQIGGDEPQSP